MFKIGRSIFAPYALADQPSTIRSNQWIRQVAYDGCSTQASFSDFFGHETLPIHLNYCLYQVSRNYQTVTKCGYKGMMSRQKSNHIDESCLKSRPKKCDRFDKTKRYKKGQHLISISEVKHNRLKNWTS